MGCRTPGITHLLGRQGKHVWLIVKELPMKAVSRDASLIPRYLARAICMYAKNFCVMLNSSGWLCFANIFSSKLFVYHCQLVAVDWHRCWMCVVVFTQSSGRGNRLFNDKFCNTVWLSVLQCFLIYKLDISQP